MLMLCLSWGFNQIAVKLVLPDVPPMLQALSRSVGALPVLLAIGWFRGVKFFERDGTLWPGVIAGVIFGIEFVLIYRGLQLTSASRAVVFLYVAPFFVALGSYVFLRERLRAAQWGGLALSFAGVALAIGVPQANVDAKGLAGRPPDRRRRRALGGHDADRQDHRADQGACGKGARLSGGAVDPDSRCSPRGYRAKPSPTFPHPCRWCCWPIRRSGWWA